MSNLVGQKFGRHGHAKRGGSRTYKSWLCMIQRCTNPNNKNYHHYGGRGIKVCKRWKIFKNFLKDIGESPTKNHTLDRIDNDGNYCKFNCRWTTQKEQNRNSRHNHLITHKEKTQCLIEWSEESGMPEHIIRWRLKHGWSVEKALTTPVGKYEKRRK